MENNNQEQFSVQALPPKYEDILIQGISGFVAPNGQLLVIAEVSDQERSFEIGPPWLLTTQHIDSFESCGLKVVQTQVEKDDSSLGELGRYVTAFEKA